jgi:hypothetical protein
VATLSGSSAAINWFQLSENGINGRAVEEKNKKSALTSCLVFIRLISTPRLPSFCHHRAAGGAPGFLENQKSFLIGQVFEQACALN